MNVPTLVQAIDLGALSRATAAAAVDVRKQMGDEALRRESEAQRKELTYAEMAQQRQLEQQKIDIDRNRTDAMIGQIHAMTENINTEVAERQYRLQNEIPALAQRAQAEGKRAEIETKNYLDTQSDRVAAIRSGLKADIARASTTVAEDLVRKQTADRLSSDASKSVADLMQTTMNQHNVDKITLNQALSAPGPIMELQVLANKMQALASHGNLADALALYPEVETAHKNATATIQQNIPIAARVDNFAKNVLHQDSNQASVWQQLNGSLENIPITTERKISGYDMVKGTDGKPTPVARMEDVPVTLGGLRRGLIGNDPSALATVRNLMIGMTPEKQEVFKKTLQTIAGGKELDLSVRAINERFTSLIADSASNKPFDFDLGQFASWNRKYSLVKSNVGKDILSVGTIPLGRVLGFTVRQMIGDTGKMFNTWNKELEDISATKTPKERTDAANKFLNSLETQLPQIKDQQKKNAMNTDELVKWTTAEYWFNAARNNAQMAIEDSEKFAMRNGALVAAAKQYKLTDRGLLAAQRANVTSATDLYNLRYKTEENLFTAGQGRNPATDPMQILKAMEHDGDIIKLY